MENHSAHSIDIKSEDFVVLIALQSLQTFIVTGYAAIDSKKLIWDFKYLWTVLLGTILFISSLISFVIIRTFVYSKNSIGKYILELLFFFSIIITCILSIIFDSFKISNMQLLFFAFSLTGYSYYNLITLLFFSVLSGILIQYNIAISGYMLNAKYLLFSDIISYTLQIIGGHALYFRMYKLCNLIVMSKKNPCKYVVISKEVKNLEEQIFKKLIKSYICINSKTYSDTSSVNNNSNNEHKSIRDGFLDLKFKSLNVHRDSKYMRKYKLLNSATEFNHTDSFSKYYNTTHSKLYHNPISKNSNLFPLKNYSNTKQSNIENHELAIQIKESSTDENLSQHKDKHSLESLTNHHSAINIPDKNTRVGVHFSNFAKKIAKKSDHRQHELIASIGKSIKRDAKQTKSKLRHENIKHNKGNKK